MGEYIKHRSGVEIKIGVCDHLWVSRDELLVLKKHGYQGYYADEFNDEIEGHLKSPATLYTFKSRTRSIEELERNDLYRESKPLVHAIIFPLAFAQTLVDHEQFYVSAGAHRSQNYHLPCSYTPEASPFLNCHNSMSDFHAYIFGERYDEQRNGRTIFTCSSCGVLFSVTQDDLEFVKNEEVKQFLKPNLNERN